MIHVEGVFDDATHTITYLVSDPETGRAAIIDPVLDYEPNAARLETRSADRLLERADANKLQIDWVLDTHAHADHLSAGHYLRQKTGAKLGIGAKIDQVQRTFAPIFNAGDVETDGRQFDILFEDEDRFTLGNLPVRIMHTPGHTPACVTYVIGDAAFVGDTLFMPDYGTARADFPGGDAATLYRSIQRILDLPPETRIFVGHDYLPESRSTFAWETTVAQQRAANVHVRNGIEESDFVARRTARDSTLSAPQLILPSLQVNIRAGDLPPAEEDGETYLKLPVNRIAG